jgi:polysaccharide pyruvyl transferase WcaK-like protein
MKKSFYFSVHTQFENLGDALINRELVREALRFGNCNLEISRCPNSFIKTLGLNEMSGGSDLNVFKGFFTLIIKIIVSRMKREKVFYFLNPGGLGKKRTFKQRVSAMAYNCLLLFYVIIGVKVNHVGISYDKSNKVDLFISKLRAKLTRSLYVRDQGTYDYLSNNGFSPKGIYPDLAFYLYGDGQVIGRNEDSKVKINGFSFRFDGKNSFSESKIKAFILSTFSTGEKYKFISQVSRDDNHMIRLASWFKANTGTEVDVICCSDDIDRVSKEYSQCQVIYSNRLHALLLSSFCGALPVAVIDVAINTKIRDLYCHVGLKDYVIDINSYTGALPDFDRAVVSDCLESQYVELKKMLPKILLEGSS